MVQRTLLTVIASGLLLSMLPACGKYAPPLPPEVFSARSVKELKVTSSTAGVAFNWRAPETDRRGNELRSMDGYRIFRKPLESEKDTLNEEIEFTQVGFVTDDHIKVRDELREQALAEGKITRKVTVPDEMKAFSFLDTEVLPGQMYLYKVVPINQGDVEGDAARQVRVVFRGDSSLIVFTDEVEEVALEEDLVQ